MDRWYSTVAHAAFCLWSAQVQSATFGVINTADTGAGSLRQAIINADGSPGDDDIVFDIPGDGPHTIVLNSALPDLTTNIRLLNDRAGDEMVTVFRNTAGATPIFSVFRVTGPATNVVMAGLSIVRGSTGASSGTGGRINISDATVTVRRCQITQNTAGQGDGIAPFGTTAKLFIP